MTKKSVVLRAFISWLPHVFYCTWQSKLTEVLGINGDGLFSCAVHPPGMFQLQGKTFEFVHLQERFTWPFFYKGLMNFCMFCHQLAVVKAQSLSAFSDAWSHCNFGKLWGFKHCHFPGATHIGVSPFFGQSSAHCDLWQCPLPHVRGIGTGSKVL